MSRDKSQFPSFLSSYPGAAVVAGIVSGVIVIGLSKLLSGDAGGTLTRNTIRLSLAWYAAALGLMMQLGPADWRGETGLGRAARWCWTWGVGYFLVHLAMAFHFFHHWSHNHAFEHTRQVSGTGEGIYASYLFTLIWLADVGWWWLRPSSFAARSVALDRILHAFMLFIVFNGMVVFETGPIRWAGLIMFAGLATTWYFVRGRARLRPA